MAVKVGINGFGRIGRLAFRAMYNDPELEVVAVNDLGNKEQLAYLLKYDSVHGRAYDSVETTEDGFVVDGVAVKVLSEREPANLPWGELGVDIVVESTGFFTDGEKAKAHLEAGAKKVIIAYRRRQDDMTALPEEIEGAIAEGAELYGLKAPHHIEADENGKVSALWVEPQIIGPIDAWGRARPIHADVDLQRIPCDIIVVAIGQGIMLRPFEEAGIKIKRGTISALSSSELANNEGVFAGGDCVTGPATVIRAIAAGKVAAANIDEYLGYEHIITCDVEIPDPSIDDKRPCGRIQLTEKEAGERKKTFAPMECGMTVQEACQEAGRCLRCDKFGFSTLKGGRTLKW